LEVWRIRRNENGTFFHSLYGTREDAIKFLPKLIDIEFQKNKWRFSEKYLDVSLSVLKETGCYISKEYGLDWEVVKCDYSNASDEENNENKNNCDFDWHDISELGFLRDGEYYDIELLDGSNFNSALFDEDEGVFKINDSDITLEEVDSFRLCY